MIVAGVFGSVTASDKTVAASAVAANNTVTTASDAPSTAAAAAYELTAAFAENCVFASRSWCPSMKSAS